MISSSVPLPHQDVDGPGDRHADVVVLTELGPGDRLDVLRPAPARSHLSSHHDVTEIEDRDIAMRDRPDLVRSREALCLQTRHVLGQASSFERSSAKLAVAELRIDLAMSGSSSR